MSIIIFRNIGGYCNYLDADHEIKVRAQQKQFVGHSCPVHIPTAFECAYANKCQQGNKCPLWQKACKMID